jgi:Dolichyl-phosphate-mannose-protein mannosyltransferase
MRFTSLIIELIRARPRLIVWLTILLQAAVWLVVAMLIYRSPPGDLATTLAFGREYQVGTDLGPPLAFWLADLAFRLAGNHVFGVYLLAQLCALAGFWTLFLLARSIVGGQQAALAVLLTMTVTAFSSPTLDFGPSVLARPLWMLLLLHSWQLIGQGRRNVWFAWSIDAGLLLLTTPAAIGLLLLVAGFALATKEGRLLLKSVDPLFALLVVVVLGLPYLVWLIRADTLGQPHLPALLQIIGARLLHGGALFGRLLLAMSAVALLVAINFGWFSRSKEDAPVIFRPPTGPLASNFVYFFAIVPAIGGSLISGLFDLDQVFGGAGIALLMSGLAVIIASGDLIELRQQHILRAVWSAAIIAPVIAVLAGTVFLPWTTGSEVATSLPSGAIGRFFADNFQRRVNQQLQAVTGDEQLASLIALDSPRPHVFFDATPKRTPWLTREKFKQTGGVVVWRASDTVGAPPPDIAEHFPGLVPEVPQTFDRLVNGRAPILRIGWAIVRPKGP